MDNKISLAIGILKSTLMVDPSYKNDLIRNVIEVLDPEEYARMEKETEEWLDEMSSRKDCSWSE